MDSLPLSMSAQAVLNRAAEDSTRLGHRYVGVEHVFAALAASSDSSLGPALQSRGIAPGEFCTQLIEAIQALEQHPWGSELLLTPRYQTVMRLATKIASRHRRREVTHDHLLEAIFREGRSMPLRLLRSRDVPVAELYEALTTRSIETPHANLPLLERYGRDLTALAEDDALTPFIGREAEIRQVTETLLRKRKNNPVLVGEAGVGKTAVVEGLATALLRERDEHPLRHARIFELSTASLVAGTKYRGDLEERMLGILKEASSDPSVIVFIDEIHTLVGAGASSGETVAASEIMKPALARGDFRCIGATTIAEYRRHIERDAALERRFEPVMVEEPSLAHAREILLGVAPSLALHHGVEILPEAIDAALELTVRYVPHRRLPDKAIDALDQSGARMRLGALSAAGGGARPQLGAAAIATTVSQWTGIPLERLSGRDMHHLLHLEENLRRAVLGQDHACQAVARAILTSKAGLSDPNRPTGTFLFLGPTGVGKTELARAIARQMFGDEKRLVRFDMSEYMEPHSVAKLIGAPPGYVGHEQEGLLISAVRTHPDCVVLFDEIEKAHPQVFDLFLQIFDEGRLTDAHGTRADFRNALIILTSNLEIVQMPAPSAPLGFKSEAPAVPPPIEARDALAGFFRPELVNRIDEILIFNRLDVRALCAIVDRHVKGLEVLAARDLRIELTEEVYAFLILNGVSDRFGARELRRTIDRHLRQPLAEELIRRGDAHGVARAVLRGERVAFEFSPAN